MPASSAPRARAARPAQVVAALADGRWHAGTALAARFGISRTAVWKQIGKLQRYGLQVQSRRGHGYRLPLPIELLDAARVEAGIAAAASARLRGLELLWETDSTNQRLLDRAAHEDITGQACLAEFQHAGRGRRGRRWEAPLGTGLCLSLGWRFAEGAAAVTALGLVVAVAGMRAMRRLGVQAPAIKWPNDLMWSQRKVGGVLVEMHGEAGGPCTVAIGIGLNVCLPPALAGTFRQPWTDLRTAAAAPVGRNAAAAAVLEALLEVLAALEAQGLAALLHEWAGYDLLRDREVEVQLPDRTVTGTARGIDAAGALLVDAGGARTRYLSGDVSLSLVR